MTWLREQATVDATGTITVDLGTPGCSVNWYIARIVVSTTSVVNETRFGLYEDSIDPLHMLDGSRDGNDDVGLENPLLPLSPGARLFAQWTNSDLLDGLGNPVVGYVAVQLVAK